jgi:hypothetical protein
MKSLLLLTFTLSSYFLLSQSSKQSYIKEGCYCLKVELLENEHNINPIVEAVCDDKWEYEFQALESVRKMLDEVYEEGGNKYKVYSVSSRFCKP